MFGKPQWFKRKRLGWGLNPICWQGWLYTSVWTGVIALPFLLLLLSMNQWPEAFIWLGLSICALVWDVRKIMREMEQEERKSLLYIGDDDPDEKVATQNFDLKMRESSPTD